LSGSGSLGASVTLISSRLTGFYKRGFPVLWFGIALVVASLSIHIGQPALLGPVALMVLIGYLFMRGLLFDLADKVYDAGDALMVKQGGREDRIPLDNVMNVNCTPFMNPPRVTLRLVRPGRLGANVSFVPAGPRALSPFAPNAIAEGLIERAYAARMRSAR
jgi:hypothetical protein